MACAVVVASGATGHAGPGVTVLPRPGGTLPVGTTTLHLVDAARPDPFEPDRSRELMVSVFYPATDVDRHPVAHYASTELIPGLEKALGTELPGVLTHSHRDAPARTGTTYPVVLYTPGAGVSRVLGTGLAEDLASRGYVVVTVDHTYETGPAVEFPGGRLVRPSPAPNGFDPAIREKYIAARLLDLRFVLDSLAGLSSGTNPDAEQDALPTDLGRVLDLERIGAVGHSSGGYTAVEAMHLDRRIDAAVDMDGQIGVDEAFGRAITEGVDRPTLVLTSAQIEQVGDGNPSFDAFWRAATGWKRHLAIADSAHYDFTDMPALVPAVAKPAAAQYIGAIDTDRMATLVRSAVAAMFDKFLLGRPDTLLDRPITDPELTAVR
ncbi:alpha/beta hydrolase family protein [Nocardia caishijiensis]|uniref:alpha/beta hydrolase family protein n=1 Tax=Nocardia caishijiensis TaxID=184756 RepID=UPI0013315946|nr:lipase [Nocardia caishijiensis]